MRWQRAPAKINLTLRVIGRRADGYHELESLVAFAGLCDWIAFEPGRDLVLEVLGPRAVEAGPIDENLVLRAARALAAHFSEVKLGRFRLVKRLPAAAGLGGGSADAAAALRLLADEARLSVDDPGVRAAATATGADVLACLRPQARMMTGVGDQLGPLIPLPKMFAVLVNPQVQAPTPKVFAALGLARGSTLESSPSSFDGLGNGTAAILDFLASSRNDLEAAAVGIAPAIDVVRERLAQIPEAIATGMSGSGATCFALFGDRRSATLARRIVAAERPDWWVEATAIH
ncbi:MAG: 4-(cytidine 5'-diphospho)-2-C-methyl-D-erythritol kinase [Roseiarcus sp.]|uniref:4-(cytidine 5'-diphospho)-2-C-methyl-D-erythritol kinase n=1 Tax=Roseiarcus sp. TaxID=1969460 RepID=UPI003C41EE69